MNNSVNTYTCKDCKTLFSISTEEAKWLQDKGFALFKRCKDCRKLRRKKNDK